MVSILYSIGNKWAERKMCQLGYRKIKENEHGASYTRYNTIGNFTQQVDILRKSSGKHLILSYDTSSTKDPNSSWAINSVCGFEISVSLAMYLKAKYLAKKYNWKKVKDSIWRQQEKQLT